MKKILVIAVMICFYLTSFGQKYLAAARQGDAEAQYQLGNCYYYGKDGVKEDGKKAVKWYRKAAKQGHASAQCMLGCCYQYEVGVKKDNQKAAELYQKSAEQGNAEALWNLGDLYFEGAGVEKDIAKGVELFQSSAELGFTKAQLHLAHLYEEGEGVPKDYVKMAEWYGKAAEQGDFNGQCFLALCYLEGEGVTKDLAKAINLLQKASDKGHPTAQARLGKCYFKGEGVRKNYDKAVKLFQKAYTSDDEAKYYLGICYLGGYGIDRNRDNALALFQSAVRKFDKAKYLIATMDDVAFGGKDKALKFLNDAADQGKIDDLDAEVLYLVGRYWTPGENSSWPYDESKYKVGEKWLLKAAEKGSIEAQIKLSDFYKLIKNEAKSLEWLQKAAEQGHGEAMYDLGEYYYYKKNEYSKAKEWFLKTVKSNAPDYMRYGACGFIGKMYEYGQGEAKDYDQALDWYTAKVNLGGPDTYLTNLRIKIENEERRNAKVASVIARLESIRTQVERLKKKYGAATVNAMMKTGEVKVGYSMAFLNEYAEVYGEYADIVGLLWLKNTEKPKFYIFEPTLQQMHMYGNQVRRVEAKGGYIFYIVNNKVVGINRQPLIPWVIELDASYWKK